MTAGRTYIKDLDSLALFNNLIDHDCVDLGQDLVPFAMRPAYRRPVGEITDRRERLLDILVEVGGRSKVVLRALTNQVHDRTFRQQRSGYPHARA